MSTQLSEEHTFTHSKITYGQTNRETVLYYSIFFLISLDQFFNPHRVLKPWINNSVSIKKLIHYFFCFFRCINTILSNKKYKKDCNT
uniref:Uncharacterized protein n=1 Tax=Lepeophtheirus salmonis TaxID=72036 RepID=A0A0K2TNS0_LEPSM